MTRDQSIKIIRAACIDANPEAKGRLLTLRYIRLGDVMLAIKTHKSVDFDDTVREFLNLWNLRKIDLTEQSDECISFLAELF